MAVLHTAAVTGLGAVSRAGAVAVTLLTAPLPARLSVTHGAVLVPLGLTTRTMVPTGGGLTAATGTMAATLSSSWRFKDLFNIRLSFDNFVIFQLRLKRS